MKTQILKLGSDVWWKNDGSPNYDILRKKAEEINRYSEEKNIRTAIVHSGAIKVQKIKNKDNRKTEEISVLELTGYAGVGQIDLIISARDLFKGIYDVSQYLVTYNEINNPLSRKHLKQNILSDLKNRIIPCINYNDKVDYDESRKDNDNLAAEMAILSGAERLIILGNYDGFCRIPEDETTLIPKIDEITKEHYKMCKKPSQNGTGGFSTKLDAAKNASLHGIPTIISNIKYNLIEIIEENAPRTYFTSQNTYK